MNFTLPVFTATLALLVMAYVAAGIDGVFGIVVVAFFARHL